MSTPALSLRLRLLISVLLVTALAVGVVSAILAGRIRGSLIANAGEVLDTRAEVEARAIGGAIDGQIVRLRALALGRALRAQANIQNESYPADPAPIIAERDARWAAPGASNPLVASVLQSTLANDLRSSAALDPDTLELMLTDRYGGLVASAVLTSDYDQSDEAWWQQAARRGLYVGPPAYDESAGAFGLIIAVAVRNPTSDQLVGVLRETYHLEAFDELLEDAAVGETGRAALLVDGARLQVDAGGFGEIGGADQDALTSARAASYALTEFAGARRLIALAPVATSADTAAMGWEVLLLQDEGEALALVGDAASGALFTALLVLLGAALVALGIAELIVRPIGRITAAAERIAAGDLSQRLGLSSGDEIGRLAASFDQMAASLEGRIAAEQAAQAERLAIQQQMIEAQERRIEELAAPLIPLDDATLLMPLIGVIDPARAAHVLQTLLQGVAERRARRVLLDLSGVPAADANVAEALLQAAAAVRLLGAEVALVGLRPDVARTIVELGRDLSAIPVYPNLRAALAVARLVAARA